MSARPEEHGGGHDVIHLGGETAVVVPLHEYRMLATLRERASAEEIEEAEIEAVIAEHEAWKAAGRPGGTIPHEAAVAELLGGAFSCESRTTGCVRTRRLPQTARR